MLPIVKIVTDVINIGLAGVVLYLGTRIVSTMRLTLQQNAVRLFLGAAAAFGAHEVLSCFPEQTETLLIAREITEALFIGCLALAMYYVANSQKTEMAGLHRLADTDRLTGLDNLATFRHLAAQRLDREKDDGLSVAVLMMDVDRFKPYNDEFGHEAGNLALQSVARTLRSTARGSDLVARYGGEEFISLLLVKPDAASLAAERIRKAIETECSPERNPALCRAVTVSVGVATPSSAAATVDDLIKIADHELYRAKKEGRNRVAASS